MVKRDQEQRRAVAQRAKKSERMAEEVHATADKLHRKMEKLHLDTIATHQRVRALRKKVKAKSVVQHLLDAQPRSSAGERNPELEHESKASSDTHEHITPRVRSR